LSVAVLEANVLTLDIPEITESSSECVDGRPGLDRQDTDRDNFPSRPLRSCSERPSSRTAEQRDELTPFHCRCLRASDRKDSIPVGSEETAALRDLNSPLCRVGVKTGHSAMSAQCPVCAKADKVYGPLISQAALTFLTLMGYENRQVDVDGVCNELPQMILRA